MNIKANFVWRLAVGHLLLVVAPSIARADFQISNFQLWPSIDQTDIIRIITPSVAIVNTADPA